MILIAGHHLMKAIADDEEGEDFDGDIFENGEQSH